MLRWRASTASPREPAREVKLPNVPPLYRPLYERVISGEASYRQAIKAKCQECLGWEDAVRGIRNCTARTCPLWPYRPYQEKTQRTPPAEGREP